jgi:hypothetical protein
MYTLKFLALSMLTMAVGLAADHPITISAGSPLTIEHDSWNQKDDQNLASAATGTVTRIEVTSNGKTFDPILFKGEQVELHLTCGAIQLAVITDSQGQNPLVTFDSKTSLKKHFNHNGNQFISKKNGGAIQSLSILRVGADVTPSPISNHTVIVIHLE